MKTNDLVFDIPSIPEIGFDTKKLLYILSNSEKDANSLETLQGITKALKINFEEDVQIIWIPEGDRVSIGPSLRLHDLAVIFGVKREQLNLKFEIQHHEVIPMEHCTLLLTHPISMIRSNQSEKLAFWKILQSIPL